MPKVSVVTPTYNRSETIKKCIDSILNQTLKDIELIIIDDGSTDNTQEIINTYNDNRLIYVKRTNHGIGNSRNYGIKKAQGDYLLFVDSDDYLRIDAIEKMYNKAIDEKLDVVVSDYIEFCQNGEKIKRHIMSFKNTKLIANPQLLLNINLGPCNKLISKKLLENNFFPEDIKYEDMPLVTKVFKEANMIGKIDEELCYFFLDNKSETTTVDNKVFDIFKSLDLVIDNLKEREYQKTIKELVVSKIAIYTIQQRCQKDKQLRNRFIDEAFCYMQKVDPQYKKNPYFKKRNKIKAFIEKHKIVTKIYCNIYNLKKA